MKDNTPKSLGLTQGSVIKYVDDLDFQMLMFKRLQIEPTIVERHKFELTDSAKDALGKGIDIDLSDLHNYKLVKRENPISIFDTSDGMRSVALSQSSPERKRSGLERDMTTDEAKLFLSGQLTCSVEAREIVGFSGYD